MNTHNQGFSLDHPRLLESLLATDKLLIIQDLDGVCMGLVRDPLTRSIERRYIEAATRLAGHFHVLTNGEHIGSRGVNGIVDKAFDTPAMPVNMAFICRGWPPAACNCRIASPRSATQA